MIELAILLGENGGVINSLLEGKVDLSKIEDERIKELLSKAINIINSKLRPIEVEVNRLVNAGLTSGKLR